MTRKNFEAIAEIFRYTQPEGEDLEMLPLQNLLICEFANYLATTNELFDRSRFLAACKKDNNQ